MARYRIDGFIVDTANATAKWGEDTRWNGNNHISVHTGSQWEHQTLYRSRRGRYWIEYTSQWQGSTPHAEWLSPQEAARWLLQNNDELPEDLTAFAEEICE